LAAVLLAPISEECIMRGMIFLNLKKYFSAPAAIVIQAVIFGIFHMNWVQGIYVIPVGLALGFLAEKSKSVLPCIYMHMLNNFMSIVLALLPEFCQTNLFCVVVAAVCLAAVWLMYRQDRERFQDAA
ncbi:MAG: CPBP family intramembrane metalloprotease, partial [Lachnospiraceae bacterium]|nr:CPBP family intramembrane metalloprotease [Lachnospiraceae bacterium]